MKKEPLRVVSVSGGKDSTALYCWAIDQWGKDGFVAIFAHTDNEHEVTYNYVRNLHVMAGGPEVIFVHATFEEKLALKGLEPSGNRFLDMMLWKGRAPSRIMQYCTEWMKLTPIREWIEANLGDRECITYSGIRAGESEPRSKMADREFLKFYDCFTERPLLRWTKEGVLRYLELKGVPLNPLYDQGFRRVGCFPCVNSGKGELSRMPDRVWERIEEWEARMGKTFFAPMVPGMELNFAKDVREWSKTTRGGTQFDMFPPESNDVASCMTTWSVCE